MNNEEKQKRRPGYPITINKNVDAVREKIHNICDRYTISASALFEALIDMQTPEQWASYAEEATRRKSNKTRKIRKISASLSKLNSTQLDELTAKLEAAGINLNEK